MLANFGERNSTARLVSLIATALLAGLALLLGLLVTAGSLLIYSVGSETVDKFRSAMLIGIPLVVGGGLGLLYLWPPLQRGPARLIPIRPGSPVIARFPPIATTIRSPPRQCARGPVCP